MNKLILPLVLLLTFISCSEEKEEDVISKIELYNIEVTETTLTFSWNLISNADTYRVLFSKKSNFADCIVDEEVGPSNYSIGNLAPASQYFLKLIASNGTEQWESEIVEIKTSYEKNDISFKTEDGLTLVATMEYSQTLLGNNSLGVIFMHEMGRDRKRWAQTTIPDSLIALGHICMRLDLRGHGESTAIPDLYVLAESNKALQYDIKAAINYLETNYISPGRTILVGASIGAIGATGGSSYSNVKGAVAVSAVYDIVKKTFGLDVVPSGVFYLAGDGDIREDLGVNCPEDAKKLYNITRNPRKVDIISGEQHGVDLVLRHDELEEEIINWIRKFE